MEDVKHYFEEFLRYERETGKLFWKEKVNRYFTLPVGREAGRLRKDGYREVKINQRYYSTHRLVWFAEYGTFPGLHIDHVNGKRSDNNILNLREVSARDNHNNRPCHRRGALPGVSFKKEKLARPWHARLAIGFKQIHIGYFATEKAAHVAYLLKREELNL